MALYKCLYYIIIISSSSLTCLLLHNRTIAHTDRTRVGSLSSQKERSTSHEPGRVRCRVQLSQCASSERGLAPLFARRDSRRCRCRTLKYPAAVAH